MFNLNNNTNTGYNNRIPPSQYQQPTSQQSIGVMPIYRFRMVNPVMQQQPPQQPQQPQQTSPMPFQKPTPQEQQQQLQELQAMTFPRNRGIRYFGNVNQPPPPPPPVNEEENKMTWGKPTWFLFHTLAEKVMDDKFLEVKDGLLNTIYNICINLPCPKCAEHAKGHIHGTNFNAITTKEDLKMFLFDFHNYVNKRKNYEIFKYEDLVQYQKAITKSIIYNFLIEFTKKSKNIRYLADELHREKISISLREWFRANIAFFQD